MRYASLVEALGALKDNIVLTSKWYILRNGRATRVIYEGEKFITKESEVLEGWVNLYQNGVHQATVPKAEIKREFKSYGTGNNS